MPSLSKLGQIVIETFLADSNFFSSIFKTHSLELMILIHEAVVKLTPLTHFLDDITNGPLLSSLMVFVLLMHLLSIHTSLALLSTLLSWDFFSYVFRNTSNTFILILVLTPYAPLKFE